MGKNSWLEISKKYFGVGPVLVQGGPLLVQPRVSRTVKLLRFYVRHCCSKLSDILILSLILSWCVSFTMTVKFMRLDETWNDARVCIRKWKSVSEKSYLISARSHQGCDGDRFVSFDGMVSWYCTRDLLDGISKSCRNPKNRKLIIFIIQHALKMSINILLQIKPHAFIFHVHPCTAFTLKEGKDMTSF